MELTNKLKIVFYKSKLGILRKKNNKSDVVLFNETLKKMQNGTNEGLVIDYAEINNLKYRRKIRESEMKSVKHKIKKLELGTKSE